MKTKLILNELSTVVPSTTVEWYAMAHWQQLQISGSSQEFSALWIIHKACMKLCFSPWNVFLPYMNNQWGFFSSVLDRKDFFLMRSFNSSATEPVEDCSLSQQVLWLEAFF